MGLYGIAMVDHISIPGFLHCQCGDDVNRPCKIICGGGHMCVQDPFTVPKNLAVIRIRMRSPTSNAIMALRGPKATHQWTTGQGSRCFSGKGSTRKSNTSNSQTIPLPNHYKFSINLPGHVADLVGLRTLAFLPGILIGALSNSCFCNS